MAPVTEYTLSMPPKKSVDAPGQLGIRLSPELMSRLDAYLRHEMHRTGYELTRSDVVRNALVRVLDAWDAEVGGSPARSKRKVR